MGKVMEHTKLLSKSNPCYIAAIEARKAPDLAEATKAVEWHTNYPKLQKLADELATAIWNATYSYDPGEEFCVHPNSVIANSARELLVFLYGEEPNHE